MDTRRSSEGNTRQETGGSCGEVPYCGVLQSITIILFASRNRPSVVAAASPSPLALQDPRRFAANRVYCRPAPGHGRTDGRDGDGGEFDNETEAELEEQ